MSVIQTDCFVAAGAHWKSIVSQIEVQRTSHHNVYVIRYDHYVVINVNTCASKHVVGLNFAMSVTHF